MRSVSTCVRGGVALLVLVTAISITPVYADNPPPAFEPPHARIQVPVGITGASEVEEPSLWDLVLVWLQHRIHVPVG